MPINDSISLFSVDIIPDMTSLPFEFTNKSISEWLKQLESLDIHLMNNEVYKALSTLKKEHKKLDITGLAIFIMRLTPVVMCLSASLEKTILKPTKGRKATQVNIRILFHLAFLHLYLAKKVELQENIVLHANYAMQIIGQVLKYCALSYDRAPEGLWACMGECYALAYYEKLLDIQVKKPLAEFKDLLTISLAVKRLLLFCLANPYRLSQQDILSLFDFCTQNCALVNFIEQDMPMERVFFWDYSANSHCLPIYAVTENLLEHCVLFNTHALIRVVNKQNLNIDGTDLLMAIFDQYRFLLEGTRFIEPSPYVFVSGFEQLVEFFIKHIRLNKVMTLNSPTVQKLDFTRLLLVKDVDADKAELEQVLSEDIWNYTNAEKLGKEVRFGAMRLVQTSQAVFFVAQTMQLKLLVGDIFICYDSALKPFLGITRRVELREGGITQESVVEICEGKVSLLQGTNAGDKLNAILLQGESRSELFLTSGKYTIGSVLQFDRVAVVLEQLLELSPRFMRYAVS